MSFHGQPKGAVGLPRGGTAGVPRATSRALEGFRPDSCGSAVADFRTASETSLRKLPVGNFSWLFRRESFYKFVFLFFESRNVPRNPPKICRTFPATFPATLKNKSVHQNCREGCLPAVATWQPGEGAARVPAVPTEQPGDGAGRLSAVPTGQPCEQAAMGAWVPASVRPGVRRFLRAWVRACLGVCVPACVRAVPAVACTCC